jgi:hypothetical protein
MNVTILYHLGLGDHIIMNGLVRHMLGEHKKVSIVSKEVNKDSIEFMYRDVDITIIYVKDTTPKTVWESIDKQTKVIPIATYGMDEYTWEMLSTKLSPVCVPYLQAHVNPMFMYTKFKVVRDSVRENTLFNKTIKNPKYIFVHDTGSNNDDVSGIQIDTDLDIIRPSMEVTNIFDYLKIIESAEEIHCINSSFACMIELTKIGIGKRFFHSKIAYSKFSDDVLKTIFTDWTFI